MIFVTGDLRPYSKSKFELNSKYSNSSGAKYFLSVFIPFFFALKAELQVLKFEFCQIKMG